jgi:hypothetical protein
MLIEVIENQSSEYMFLTHGGGTEGDMFSYNDCFVRVLLCLFAVVTVLVHVAAAHFPEVFHICFSFCLVRI